MALWAGFRANTEVIFRAKITLLNCHQGVPSGGEDVDAPGDGVARGRGRIVQNQGLFFHLRQLSTSSLWQLFSFPTLLKPYKFDQVPLSPQGGGRQDVRGGRDRRGDGQVGVRPGGAVGQVGQERRCVQEAVQGVRTSHILSNV